MACDWSTRSGDLEGCGRGTSRPCRVMGQVTMKLIRSYAKDVDERGDVDFGAKLPAATGVIEMGESSMSSFDTEHGMDAPKRFELCSTAHSCDEAA
jgi:hypothetical protein